MSSNARLQVFWHAHPKCVRFNATKCVRFDATTKCVRFDATTKCGRFDATKCVRFDAKKCVRCLLRLRKNANEACVTTRRRSFVWNGFVEFLAMFLLLFVQLRFFLSLFLLHFELFCSVVPLSGLSLCSFFSLFLSFFLFLFLFFLSFCRSTDFCLWVCFCLFLYSCCV